MITADEKEVVAILAKVLYFSSINMNRHLTEIFLLLTLKNIFGPPLFPVKSDKVNIEDLFHITILKRTYKRKSRSQNMSH